MPYGILAVAQQMANCTLLCTASNDASTYCLLIIRADVLFAYKLLFDLTALHTDDFCILRKSTRTRGHPHKLFLPRCSTDGRKYFFSQRIVKLWNEFPVDTYFYSIESFKGTLDGFNFAAYCYI